MFTTSRTPLTIGAGLLILVLATGCSGIETGKADDRSPNENSSVSSANPSSSTASSPPTLVPANDPLGLLDAIISEVEPEELKPSDRFAGVGTTACRGGVSVAVPAGYTLTPYDIGEGEQRQVLLDDSIPYGAVAPSFVSAHQQRQSDLEGEVQSMAFSGQTSALVEGATDVLGKQIAWPTADYAYQLTWMQDVENASGDVSSYRVIALYLGSESNHQTAMGAIWVPVDFGEDHVPTLAVQTMKFC